MLIPKLDRPVGAGKGKLPDLSKDMKTEADSFF